LYLDGKRIIKNVMQRSVWFALLMAAILVAVPLQAQRGGGGFHGGPGMAGGDGAVFGGRPGFPNGSFPHYPRYHRFRNYGFGFGSWFYPYWDEDDFFDYAEAANVPSPPVTAPPVIVVESRDYRPPAPAPESPKLIEVPQTKGETAVTPKPEPPTLFVFANGERLEARRYMLTADSLQVEIGRQRRSISLGEIDIDATIAANRERGIDLKIPTGKNEIFLGF
jgi:hypothetical protein